MRGTGGFLRLISRGNPRLYLVLQFEARLLQLDCSRVPSNSWAVLLRRAPENINPLLGGTRRGY